MKKRMLAGIAVLILTLFAVNRAAAEGELTSGVARISLIHGDVSTQRGDSGDWAAAALNQPVVSGDKVSTGVRSRAEVQLDYANVVRLGDNSEATVADLSRTQIQLQVGRGLVDYTVFRGADADVEIDTPNVAIHPSQKDGVYRIEVNSEGETQVIVRKGEAEISTPQGSTRLEKGHMVTVRGSGDSTEYREASAPSSDSWDSWNRDRDNLMRNAQSWSHTNRYYVGSEDLDAYGRWVTVPDYGQVWSPVVDAGWAPYRAGRWVWEPGWGWTWVSYEPWGWAPYHYGRWFVYGGSWVWWPGPVYYTPYYRPLWAPAYVSFFGFGSGFGFGFGFGSVGWLPVGPCDPFYPWYGRYRSHFNSVNVTNITNITNITNVYTGPGRGFHGVPPLHAGSAYSNLRRASMDQRVRGGISSVSAEQFGKGRQTPAGVSAEAFRSGHLMAGNIPVVPTREALSVSNRPAAAGTVQRGAGQERFFTKSGPRAAPQSFDRQAAEVQHAIQRSPQSRNMNGSNANRAATNQVAGPAAGAAGVSRPNPGVRFPAGNAQGAATASTNAQAGVERSPSKAEGQGWRNFGTDRRTNHSAGAGPARGTVSMPGGNSGAGPANPSTGAGWRRFSDSSPAQRGTMISSPAERGTAKESPKIPNSLRQDFSSGSGNGDRGWRQFTPQSGGAVQDSSPRGGSMSIERGAGGSFPRGEDMGRPGNMRSTSPEPSRVYSRPPLEMRQPIVTQRSEGGSVSHGGGGGPSHGGGGFGGGGGGHAPAGGGSHGSGGGPHQGAGHNR